MEMQRVFIAIALVLVLGFVACPAQGDLTLPYNGSASSYEVVFKIANTNTDTKGLASAPGPGGLQLQYDPRCAAMFEALGPLAIGAVGAGNVAGVWGKSEGGIGVRGTSDTDKAIVGTATGNSDTTNYGGSFEAKGKTGFGVYGLASHAGETGNYDIHNYGGYFEACGYGGIGVRGVGRWGGWFQSNQNDSGTGGVGVIAKGSHAAAILYGKLVICSYATETTLIELGEGLDYAEGFRVQEKADIAPGSVLVIDADHPGQLRLSDAPYDTKVSGIVAGARGLGSGVRLGGDRFDCDVALAGRVYCNVEATEASVEPGDLLTTSSIPGHAMKVVDRVRAQGAILGKAMQRLEKGTKGQILVLVTLQ
jgi:hypothetical protein